MINTIIIEGIVVREPWKYMDDLFFRLVTYRDSDLPAKKLDQERDAGDYVNIRVYGGANGLIHIRRGMRLRIHGFLQSRDYRESLEEFVNKARKNRISSDLAVEIQNSELKPNQILIDRNIVEIISRRIIVLDTAGKKSKNRKVPAGNNIEHENHPLEDGEDLHDSDLAGE